LLFVLLNIFYKKYLNIKFKYLITKMNNLFKTNSFVKKESITITPFLEHNDNILKEQSISEEQCDFDLVHSKHKFKLENKIKTPVKDSCLNSSLQNQEFILGILLELRNFDEINGTDLFKNINYTNLRKFILK